MINVEYRDDGMMLEAEVDDQLAAQIVEQAIDEHLVFGVGGLDRGFGFLAGHVGPGEFLDDAMSVEA